MCWVCASAHDKSVRELALDNPAPFVPYVLMKRGDEVRL